MRYLATILVWAFVAHCTNAQIVTLTSDDGESGDWFGTSVALNQDGSVLVVGAVHDDDVGVNAGAAYIFERTGTSWEQTWKILAPVGAEQKFGNLVDISGDGNRVLIATLHGHDGPGGAYIYHREEGGWLLEVDFRDVAPDGDLRLGSSIALSTDGLYALVVVYNQDQLVVREFERSGTTWTLNNTISIVASDLGLSADGQVALVSQVQQNPYDVPTGYVFSKQGEEWILETELLFPNETPLNGQLGLSAALSDDGRTVLLGAPLFLATPKRSTYQSTGGFLWTKNGGDWSFGGHLDSPPGYHVGEEDGWDVALNQDGTRAMVGSPAHYDCPSTLQVFDLVGDRWIQVHGSEFSNNTDYGNAVSLSSDGLWGAAGAPAIGSNCDGRSSGGYPGYVLVYGPQDIPVELTGFTAQADGNSVHLAWETSSETNNAGFEVQTLRSDAWTALGFVEGRGTTTEAQSYTFDEVNLDVGTHTFRLKQIDFDGAFEYSQEVEAIVEVVGTHQLSSAYPNPFNPQSQFRLAVARDQHVTATLYNALGRRVAVLFNGQIEGQTTQVVAISGEALPSGTYFVRVLGVTFVDTLQITLAK